MLPNTYYSLINVSRPQDIPTARVHRHIPYSVLWSILYSVALTSVLVLSKGLHPGR